MPHGPCDGRMRSRGTAIVGGKRGVGKSNLALNLGIRLAGRVGVVVNMARSRPEAAAVARRLALVAGRFLGLSPENLGFVPLDRHVPQAVRARVPVTERYPRCAASLAIEEVCMKLEAPLRAGRVAPSLWSRVAGVFL